MSSATLGHSTSVFQPLAPLQRTPSGVLIRWFMSQDFTINYISLADVRGRKPARDMRLVTAPFASRYHFQGIRILRNISSFTRCSVTRNPSRKTVRPFGVADNMAADQTKLEKFLKAMQSIYGDFESLKDLSAWTPPSIAEGHRGRYLWTDGFAVVNFLTLYKQTSDPRYIAIARRLVQHVHDILGFTRDGKLRLPGASEEDPLAGGLRIGKPEAGGDDGDGQYFHYLTVWQYALNRMTLITGED